ncbi:hypothetical protein FHR92_004660 [Fontibacillus solani]|uniref:Uncharacterized protein n=1 Tax=Fontibacillus solani TaxID=1572857 RepID=A0A7W3SXP4_9BACL|nr:hypothetical protein [Fontibacillus solani]
MLFELGICAGLVEQFQNSLMLCYEEEYSMTCNQDVEYSKTLEYGSLFLPKMLMLIHVLI